MTKAFLLGAAAALLIAVALAVWLRGGTEQTAHGQGAVTVVGIDLDPTGNGCPGDGVHDCTLGSIERCREVPMGATVQFDVFLDDLPDGDNLLGFEYQISFPSDGAAAGLTAQVHANPLVNLQAQSQGSWIIDFSEGVPDPASPHRTNVGDLGVVETNPPFTQGPLGRYTLSLVGLAAGVYPLTFLGQSSGFRFRDLNAVDVFDPGGPFANGCDDDLDSAVDEDRVLEAALGVGVALPDSDSDGLCDAADNCPLVSNPGEEDADGDRVGDACDNCPSVDNPGQEERHVPSNGIGDHCEDADLDAFTDHVELWVGTDADDACPDNPSDDAWPLDMNMDAFITVVGDVLAYSGNIGRSVAQYPQLKRLDVSTDGYITVVGDVLQFSGNIGSGCT